MTRPEAHDPPPIRIITDAPLVHRDICLAPKPVLVHSGGWVCCAHCAARVPGRVEPDEGGEQP